MPHGIVLNLQTWPQFSDGSANASCLLSYGHIYRTSHIPLEHAPASHGTVTVVWGGEGGFQNSPHMNRMFLKTRGQAYILCIWHVYSYLR